MRPIPTQRYIDVDPEAQRQVIALKPPLSRMEYERQQTLSLVMETPLPRLN
jgi:hypothetical protein